LRAVLLTEQLFFCYQEENLPPYFTLEQKALINTIFISSYPELLPVCNSVQVRKNALMISKGKLANIIYGT